MSVIEKTTEAEIVASLAQQPRWETVEGVPFLHSPSGLGQFTTKPYPELLAKPLRNSGTTEVHDVDSFIFVAKRHKDENSLIYLDVDYANNKVKATAVFNEQGKDDPRWRDHRAVFTPRSTEEWKRWLSFNKKQFGQVDFAHFLEENITDITNNGTDKLPSGSDVLTFVSSLEETRKVKYGSAVNLQNGMVQLEFIEDGDDGQKGKLELFREFAIGVSPFFGGAAYKVEAFLRYRIDRNTGQIAFWYELKRHEKVLEDAAKEVIERIKAETGVPVIYGTPS